MTAFQEEGDFRQVRFNGGNDLSATITVEDLNKLCEELELGKIEFHFVRQFRGNAVIDGKIESISSKNKFLCFSDDGDIHTHPRKEMMTVTETNFPELGKMSGIDSRTSADNEESEAELREINSEEETL